MSSAENEQSVSHSQLAYVATQSAKADEELVLELRVVEDSDLAVLAYTQLGKLVDCCGEYQPWAAVPVSWVPDLVKRSGADRVVWDAPLAEEQRHMPLPEPEAGDADGEAHRSFEDGEAIQYAVEEDVVTNDVEAKTTKKD